MRLVEALQMMGDFFWDIATSSPVLGAVAAILGAALVVGYFPLLKWFPVVGQYVPAARLAVILSAALLCFLVGFRVSDEREEAKSLRLQLAAKQVDIDAANDAAAEADEARQKLAEQASTDQKRIAYYATQLKRRPNGACALTPDDFGGGLRNRKRSP